MAMARCPVPRYTTRTPGGGPGPANLSTVREDHTATLLADGQVLVVGGSNQSNDPVLSSAELYDPVTKQWTPTGSLHDARGVHTATLLPGSRVLVAGGYNDAGGSKALSSAEVYDPATGLWSLTGSLNAARGSHTATALLDHRVLVAGGFALPDGRLSSAELYDWACCRVYLLWAAHNAVAP